MERLETLKVLLDKAFISQAEYDERRRQIIDDLTKTSLPYVPLPVEQGTSFDAEEGFGPKQKLATLPPVLLRSEEQGEEGFGPKPKLGDSGNPSVRTIPRRRRSNERMTDEGESSDSEAGVDRKSMLFDLGEKEEDLVDGAREMGITEKYELSRQIGSLPGTCLRVILQIVKDTSPEALERNGEDWIFDLKTLPSVTLWKLHEYVATWNREDNKEKGSQGEEKQVLAAAVITNDEEMEDADNSRTGRKRPRVSPSFVESERRERTKRPSRATKKSKVRDEDEDDEDYVDEEEEAEEEEKESEIADEEICKEKEQQQQSEDVATGNEAKPKSGGPFKIQVCIYSLAKKNPSSRPYVCDACGKSFKDRSNLAQHLRVHTKERPYVCSFEDCKKSFAHSASLKEHLNTHVGAKPHICDYPRCGQSFAQASNLRRHQRGVHSGERPFECTYMGCGKRFAQNSNLKQHMEKVHQVWKKEESDKMQIHR